jgi:hypothetical protein
VNDINATSLAAGNVTYQVTETDAAGDSATATQGATDDVKHGLAPTITSAPQISSADAGSDTAAGTGQPGDKISVTISDSSGHSTGPQTTTVGTDSTWSVSDINATGLSRGTVTYQATETDAAGDSATATQAATDDVNSGGTTLPPSSPVTGSTPQRSKKGLTEVDVAFSEPLEAASAENSSDYHAFGAVTKVVKHRRETVYSKPIRIKSVGYNTSTDTAQINLAKPVKGKVEVQVSGTFTTTSGTEETVDYTILV